MRGSGERSRKGNGGTTRVRGNKEEKKKKKPKINC
jgi:hypothetical protein